MLERFAPRLFLSEGECDVSPAEFEPHVDHPKVSARNGTLYGRVFPRHLREQTGVFVEAHFYHLWSRDCGKASHALDAEHVSVLLRSDQSGAAASAWTAVLWYAAAHEATACNRSQLAKAAAIGAEHGGARVWVSRGKHASYLSLEACSGGCGGDVCLAPSPMPPGRIVNLGEPGAFQNGASWVASSRWPLSTKLRTDFEPPVVSAMGEFAGPKIVTLSSGLETPQAILLSSVLTADALQTSSRNTGYALGIASAGTGQALSNTASGVGLSLDRTASAVSEAGRKTGSSLARSVRETRSFLRFSRKPAERPAATVLRQQ